MCYKIIKPQNYSEIELREIWKNEYCDNAKPIFTFDHIRVKFFEDMFDHAFFESANRRQKDKSILSLNRLEKIYWIKDTLQDNSALIKKGWDKAKKKYVNDRRVALVKGNYVVIIRLTGEKTAKFMTAYEIQEKYNIDKIFNSPDWCS